MSKKLEKAAVGGTVRVKSRIQSQLSIWYRDREGNFKTKILDPYQEAELAPELTDAARLIRSSNIKTLVKAGNLMIL